MIEAREDMYIAFYLDNKEEFIKRKKLGNFYLTGKDRHFLAFGFGLPAVHKARKVCMKRWLILFLC
jgi:hypothetical protein